MPETYPERIAKKKKKKKKGPKTVKAKKACCGDRPRCKRCPVTCKRLEKAGLAVREGRRTYVLVDVTKRDLKIARAR
ncbi:MAG TPA: hypothetical protein VM266_12830 [Solirubrobacteraceae bacterium]|nr:hypothetical protein [Solirubrobacteraceae bacterium]